MRTQLASPAESGTTIILGRLCISPAEAVYATLFCCLLTARSLIVIYLKGPQGQYIWEWSTAECHQPVSESTVISGNTRHHRLQPYETPPLRPYKTSPLWPYKTSPLQPYEAHLRLSPVYATLPPLATLCGARNKTNKQTSQHDTQLVIPIVASLKPCESEQENSTTVAWGWPSIGRRGNPCAQKEKWNNLKSNLKSTSITIAPSPLWISGTYPSRRPWLVCLPHSRLCACRSSWLFAVYADLDCCDSKRLYA